MIVHLIDGTYELFRQFFGARRANSGVDTKFGAVRGVLNDVLHMFETGGPYVGVATDRVIESFRNQMWPGYKTGFGIDPVLWGQFRPLEDGLEAMGVALWPMVELEADDALASAAAIANRAKSVEKVCIWTPDKDLAQCVVSDRVVQVDRRRNIIRNEAGVQEKFGVSPASIPDYLALVGDTADGYPGIDGFGAKSAAAILRKFGTIEAIPADASEWRANVTSAGRLAKTLSEQRDLALLFKDLATLRMNAPLFKSVEELRWQGPTNLFAKFASAIEAPELVARAERARAKVSQ